jgi:hypothetical protein
MILLAVLTVLAAAAIVAAFVSVSRDGYRPVRTDASRIPDLSPAVPTTTRPAHAAQVRSRRRTQRKRVRAHAQA